MKYKRRILEVTLDKVTLKIKGRKKKEEKHVVSAGLVYPRPGIAQKVAMQPITVTEGEARPGKGRWSDRILFKEVVQGPFGLTIDVSRAMSDSEMSKVIQALAKSVVKVAGKEIAAVAGGPWSGLLMGLPLKLMSGLISKKETPDSVGAGAREFCADIKWKSGKVKRRTIKLVAEENVYVMRRTRRGGSLTMVRKRIVKAGEATGSVVVKMRIYD